MRALSYMHTYIRDAQYTMPCKQEKYPQCGMFKYRASYIVKCVVKLYTLK